MFSATNLAPCHCVLQSCFDYFKCRQSSCIYMFSPYVEATGLYLDAVGLSPEVAKLSWEVVLPKLLGKYNLTFSITYTIIARWHGKRFFQHIKTIKMRRFWGDCQGISILPICKEGHCFNEVMCVPHGTHTD